MLPTRTRRRFARFSNPLNNEDDDREKSMFDLIVGEGFVNELAEVEEVGGDPSFLWNEEDDEEEDR